MPINRADYPLVLAFYIGELHMSYNNFQNFDLSWTGTTLEDGGLVIIDGELEELGMIDEFAKVAKFQAFYLDLHNYPNPYFYLFDSDSELDAYYAPLFLHPNPELEDALLKDPSLSIEDLQEMGLMPEQLLAPKPRPHFADTVTDIVGLEIANVLILQKMEILPEFRGTGLGLWLMLELIRLFGKPANVVILQVFPLQLNKDNIKKTGHNAKWVRNMQYADFGDIPPATQEAQELLFSEKILAHWQKLGFEPISPHSRFMVLNTDSLESFSTEERHYYYHD